MNNADANIIAALVTAIIFAVIGGFIGVAWADHVNWPMLAVIGSGIGGSFLGCIVGLFTAAVELS